MSLVLASHAHPGPANGEMHMLLTKCLLCTVLMHMPYE